MKDQVSRRCFIQQSTVLAATTLVGAAVSDAAEEQGATAAAALPVRRLPHAILTPAGEFSTVARGNPEPHTLTGDARINARLTPETWRLEVTADPFVEEPFVKRPASLERALTIADGSALDFAGLIGLGAERGVKFVKAIQCLNIPEPLGQGLWEGVPLRDVLRLCGRMENVRRIYYWGFHNNDPKQIFRSSLSYRQVMETPPGDLPVFLAYKLNGEPIPPVRGGPVRLLVPWAHGFKSVKWLQHIFVTNDYRTNDTYALQNNDPDSYLKTAAYIDDGPQEISAATPVELTGLVIAGLSGLERVEYWVREVGDAVEPLADDSPELLRGPWVACELLPPPNWDHVLPAGVSTKEILGFDKATGAPLSWPLPYGMASYFAEIRGLKPAKYELRVRAVDLNGFAQPEPRPQQKSGKNSIQVRRFEVV